MLISFVIPAYNASATLGGALASIFSCPFPVDWAVEALVVDDGSQDHQPLTDLVGKYPHARIIRHTNNCGMCAARNSGIAQSRGDMVCILDADDQLVQDWPTVMADIIAAWPADTHLCYAACRNNAHEITASDPDYTGYLSLDDLLHERHSGEYMPIFRGQYLRNKPYTDIGTRKSCGIISYIDYALDRPFWISNHVLRIYNTDSTTSITKGWTRAGSSLETITCYKILFERYGDLLKSRAPRIYRSKKLKLAVYMKLAHQNGYWKTAFSPAPTLNPIETAGATLLLLVPCWLTRVLAQGLKKLGVIKQYG